MSDRSGKSAPGVRPASGQPRKPEDFAAMYETTPPWDIGRPQNAFLRLAGEGALLGRVLDVGCGTGENTLMAAALGLDATGVDTAPAAIAAAESKARERGVRARFLVHNVLELPALNEQFDTALDCGLFHVLNDEDRRAFVESLSAVVRPGGRYLMLCFSDRQPGDRGPRRVTEAEIRSAFSRGWRVDSIDAVALESISADIQGWLACLTRT